MQTGMEWNEWNEWNTPNPPDYHIDDTFFQLPPIVSSYSQ